MNNKMGFSREYRPMSSRQAHSEEMDRLLHVIQGNATMSRKLKALTHAWGDNPNRPPDLVLMNQVIDSHRGNRLP